MHYTEKEHDGHFRAPRKCRKHEPQASVICISRVLSNARRVLSQCNTIRLLHLLYDVELMWLKAKKKAKTKHAFSMF